MDDPDGDATDPPAFDFNWLKDWSIEFELTDVNWKVIDLLFGNYVTGRTRGGLTYRILTSELGERRD